MKIGKSRITFNLPNNHKDILFRVNDPHHNRSMINNLSKSTLSKIKKQNIRKFSIVDNILVSGKTIINKGTQSFFFFKKGINK
jgi:hypothetical protein